MSRSRDRKDKRIEALARQALDGRYSTRIDRDARERIATRLGIGAPPTARRWPWVMSGAVAAAILTLAVLISQVDRPPVAQEASPSATIGEASPTVERSTAPSPTSTPVPALAFGTLPSIATGATAQGLDPDQLQFSLAPELILPDLIDALVGEVTFSSVSRQDAEEFADRFGFAGSPEETRYGRATAWSWREGTRTLVVEDDGSIEYGDPGGSQGPIGRNDDLGESARQWLVARGADTERLTDEPLLREIGDGRVQVSFNPPPTTADAGSIEYYRQPGSGAFPYASVTLLANGAVQQASYRDARVTAVSRYPVRPASEVIALLGSGEFSIDGQPPADVAPGAVGIAVVKSVQLGYQLVPPARGNVAYLVPGYRVTGTVTWPDDRVSDWRTTLPAIDPSWVDD